MFRVITILFLTCITALAAEIPQGMEGYKAQVKSFFNEYCIDCHGPKKSKGKITLHSLDGDLSQGVGLEHWESVLEVLIDGEMPPEDEDQPTPAARA